MTSKTETLLSDGLSHWPRGAAKGMATMAKQMVAVVAIRKGDRRPIGVLITSEILPMMGEAMIARIGLKIHA